MRLPTNGHVDFAGARDFALVNGPAFFLDSTGRRAYPFGVLPDQTIRKGITG
jgi:hypothetical protein